MITPTGITFSDYCDAIKAGNKSHVRIMFPVQNITFTDDDISFDGGITISTESNPSNDMKYDSSICSEIVICFLNNSKFNGFDWSEEFSVEFGIEIGNDTYWVTVGYFTGIKPQRFVNSETIEFTAYDRMRLFDIIADDIIDTIDFSLGTATINTVLNAITNSVGIGYNPLDNTNNLSLPANPFGKGITCRDVFAIIAEAIGQFAYIDETGSLSYTYYRDNTYGNPYKLRYDDYYNLNLADSKIKSLDGVTFINTNDPSDNVTYPVGATGNLCYVINNPIIKMNQFKLVRVSNIYTHMITIGSIAEPCSYKPCTVEAVGNWLINVGDILQIYYYDYHAKSYGITSMPIYSRTLSWNGSCTDIYESRGNIYREIPSELEYESLTENNIANDLTTTDPGYVLDARQGKELDDKIADCVQSTDVYNGLNQTDPGYVLDARQGKALKDQLGDLQVVKTIMASNSTSFDVENYTSYILFAVSNSSTHQGMWVIMGFSSGSQVRTIQAGSAITISVSGLTISISHSSGRNTRYTLIKCGVFTS